MKRVLLHVSYPDMELPPINLWVLPDAWWFYATQQERKNFLERYINSICRDSYIYSEVEE